MQLIDIDDETESGAGADASVNTSPTKSTAGISTRPPLPTPSVEEEEVSSGGLPSSLVEAARAVPGRRVCVVGGRTGVGKTRVLMALRQMGARLLAF